MLVVPLGQQLAMLRGVLSELGPGNEGAAMRPDSLGVHSAYQFNWASNHVVLQFEHGGNSSEPGEHPMTCERFEAILLLVRMSGGVLSATEQQQDEMLDEHAQLEAWKTLHPTASGALQTPRKAAT